MKYLFRTIFIIAISWISLISVSVKAATINGDPPVITITSLYGETDSLILDPVNSELNSRIGETFVTARSEANDRLARYSKQNDLAKGFANANTYTSRAATLQGYEDYSIGALSAGVMLGLQAPTFDIDQKYIEGISSQIEEEGDIYLGASAGLAMINAGVNAGFIYPGLFLNLKYGTLDIQGKDISDDAEGFSYKSTIAGLGANFTLFRSWSFMSGLAKWRGVSIGTGFYYCKTDVNVTIEPSLITEPIESYTVPGYGTIDGWVAIDPSFTLGLKMETMTAPLDVTTSVQLLWVLNFNIGAGVDFNYGKSDIILVASGDVTTDITDKENITATVTPGNITLDGSTKGVSPSAVNPRITTGLGFNFSIIKIDIPVAIYLDSGVSVGITAGIVW